MSYPRQYNAATDFIDRHVDNGLGDKTVFIDVDDSVTYGDLRQNTCRVANLLETYGIEQESRVALLAHDTVHWPAVFWGAIRAGVIPAALNTLLSTRSNNFINRSDFENSFFNYLRVYSAVNFKSSNLRLVVIIVVIVSTF